MTKEEATKQYGEGILGKLTKNLYPAMQEDKAVKQLVEQISKISESSFEMGWITCELKHAHLSSEEAQKKMDEVEKRSTEWLEQNLKQK